MQRTDQIKNDNFINKQQKKKTFTPAQEERKGKTRKVSYNQVSKQTNRTRRKCVSTFIKSTRQDIQSKRANQTPIQTRNLFDISL